MSASVAPALPQPETAPVPELPSPATPRRVGGTRREDVLAFLGSAAAALSLSYLAYFVLLPWSGALGFLAVCAGTFVVFFAVATSLESPGPIVRDRVAAVLVHGVAGLMLLALVVVVVYAVARGWSALSHLNFFRTDLSTSGPLDPLTQGGMLHAIAGTLVMITIALIVTVPLGIVAAVFLAEIGGPFSRFVRTVVEAMTALPSVIAGLFVYALIVTAQDAVGIGQKSGLAASLALSVMMLPIVIRAADVVLRLVPGTLKEAAAALGAPRWRVVWHVVLPTSRSGVMTAIILGTARGIGETSPVLLTAGYATGFNLDPLSGPMTSLPLATFVLTRSPEPTQIARGFGAAAVLMLLVLVLFVTARVIGGRGGTHLSSRQARRRAALSRADLARFDARSVPPQDAPVPTSSVAPPAASHPSQEPRP